jgi:hypothetical protein
VYGIRFYGVPAAGHGCSEARSVTVVLCLMSCLLELYLVAGAHLGLTASPRYISVNRNHSENRDKVDGHVSRRTDSCNIAMKRR